MLAQDHQQRGVGEQPGAEDAEVVLLRWDLGEGELAKVAVDPDVAERLVALRRVPVERQREPPRAGIEAALRSLLDRFAPGTFDQRLEASALDRFVPGNRKARQWDLLLELYEDIAKEAQDDFWSVFEREFRRAYSTSQGGRPLT